MWVHVQTSTRRDCRQTLILYRRHVIKTAEIGTGLTTLYLPKLLKPPKYILMYFVKLFYF